MTKAEEKTERCPGCGWQFAPWSIDGFKMEICPDCVKEKEEIERQREHDEANEHWTAKLARMENPEI